MKKKIFACSVLLVLVVSVLLNIKAYTPLTNIFANSSKELSYEYNVEDLVGQEIIRIKPAGKDYSFTREPVKLLKIVDNELVVKYENDEVHPLSPIFTDNNWIPLEVATSTDKNASLNELIGKNIRRIRPTYCGDKGFMRDSVKLISASKYHMVVECDYLPSKSKTMILGPGYTGADDWVEDF